MSVPLFDEQDGSGVGSDSTDQQAAATGAPAAGGPSVTISFSDGSTMTLEAEDLQLAMLTIQTLLLVYVAYLEVKNA